jgi:hypothetical protein
MEINAGSFPTSALLRFLDGIQPLKLVASIARGELPGNATFLRVAFRCFIECGKGMGIEGVLDQPNVLGMRVDLID